MRILILSISKGSGHQHAAKAIESAFQQNYPSLKTYNENFFDLVTNPVVEIIVSKTYLRLLQSFPKLWAYMYDNEKVFKWSRGLREMGRWKTSTIKYKQVLDDVSPSVIICTQALPCEATSALKRNGLINTPLVAIVTDFVAHAYWVHQEVDLYIVPTERTKNDLLKRGIPESRVKILGIPIRQCFEHNDTLQDKKDIVRKLGLYENLPKVLIMGGCHGFGPMRKLVQEFSDSQRKFQVIVVTGLNTKMRRELNLLKSQLNIPLQVYGYIDNVHELMSISNILISKPGGMTITEALVKRIPMIITNPLPGQEEKNSQFLVNSGAAIRADNVKEVVEMVLKLMDNKEWSVRMQKSMDELVIHYSSKRIVDSVMQHLSGQEEKEFVYA